MDRRSLALMFLAAALSPFAAAAAGDETPPRLTVGFVERFRLEAWDNAVGLDDKANDGSAYTRNRTNLSLRWRAARNLEVVGKLTNEFRIYLAPKDRPFDRHEVFFDNAYVKWTIRGRRPLAVTAGRQDINLGEGFVVADGTPLDGSRSYYFNALRLDAGLGGPHKLILFAHATETTDKLLPVVNKRPQALVEQPEKALAAYYSGAIGKVKVDAYVIRKTAEATALWPVAERIDTFGARTQASLLRGLALTAESAVQTGSHGDAGRLAFGGLAHLDLTPAWKVPYLKTLTLGGLLLSGDDPGTSRMEGWDPVFGRWPKWSEGYIYTLIRESRVAYWSNLDSIYAGLGFDFGSRANGTLTVHRLGAERVRPGTFPGGTGLDRGTLVVGRLSFVISKALSGHVHWERFKPGDFYAPGRSGFDWIRFELMLRY
jgi:hypothetical protein